MNPVTSIDPTVFSARVNPQRQAEQAGPNRVDRKPTECHPTPANLPFHPAFIPRTETLPH